MATEQRRADCPGNESVSGLQLVDLPLATGTGVSTSSYRPSVPDSTHRVVLQPLHRLFHPGIRAPQKLLAERLVQSGMNKKVVLEFPPEQGTVPQQASAGAFTSHFHLDMVGFLPHSMAKIITSVALIGTPVELKLPLCRIWSRTPTRLFSVAGSLFSVADQRLRSLEVSSSSPFSSQPS
nr:unnamed protein product [Spirometra erinaceieuropaei]